MTKEKSELDVLREKVEKANREFKVADNEHERTKSDVSVEKDEDEELNVDNNKDDYIIILILWYLH